MAKKQPWLVAAGRYDPEKRSITCTAILDGLSEKQDSAATAMCGVTVPGPVDQNVCDMAAIAVGRILMTANHVFDANAWPLSDTPSPEPGFTTVIRSAQPPEDKIKRLHELLDAAGSVLGSDPDETRMNKKSGMAAQVLDLYEKTPAGRIADADTILQDFMDEAEPEISGAGPELIRIWQESRDKASVEKLFEAFTGRTFQEYLAKCVESTTTPEK